MSFHSSSEKPALGARVSTVDNYCLYWLHDIAGCDMLLPGGYCDPDGDGDFADADWVLGFDQYSSACGVVCGDSDCSAPSENCSTCPEDCGQCAVGCPNGACDGDETCTTCPQDCGALLYSFSPPGVWDSFRLDGHVSELAGVIGPATCAP